jgi:hypothetical protein
MNKLQLTFFEFKIAKKIKWIPLVKQDSRDLSPKAPKSFPERLSGFQSVIKLIKRQKKLMGPPHQSPEKSKN